MSRWLRSKTEVILVVGPPLPGLLYDYLQTNTRTTDFVIDYETIALTHGHTRDQLTAGFYDEAVQDERNQLLVRARRGEIRAPRIWITSSNANAEAMTDTFPRHRVVVVDPGEDECKRIGKQGAMSARFVGLIEDWYDARHGTTTRERERKVIRW
jgi:hypothetical protein